MGAATAMFLTDATLGRLATWLRLLGYDTDYVAGGDERALLRRAASEQRILLTRNTRLLRRRGLPPHLFIEADDFRSQLRAVVRAFNLDPTAGFLARCSRCNAVLEALTAEAARAVVPPYVAATQSSFARCPNCRRVYWPATHVARMRRELARLA